MANFKSDQITKIDASPPERLAPDEDGGKRRFKRFSFTVPAGNVAINDTVELLELPHGRIVGGYAEWDAMTTGAGAATLQLGDGVTANRFLEATSVDAAGNTPFANTRARGYGSKVGGGRLVATATVEAWAAGAVIVGEIEYVAD